MLDTVALLAEMTRRVQPGPDQAHAITLAPEPNVLRLTLMQGNRWVSINLNAEDLARSVTQVCDEIMSIFFRQAAQAEEQGHV